MLDRQEALSNYERAVIAFYEIDASSRDPYVKEARRQAQADLHKMHMRFLAVEKRLNRYVQNG